MKAIWQNKIFKWVSISVVIVIAIIFIAAIVLLKTGPGRSYIKTTLEMQISKAINGTATLEDIKPGLPGRISIKNLSLNDNNDSSTPGFIHIQSAELVWHPFSLLSRQIDIEELIIEDVTFLKIPELPEKENETSKSNANPLQRLQKIQIQNFNFTNIKIAPELLGLQSQTELVTLNAKGHLNWSPGKADILIGGATNSRSDQISIDGVFDLAKQKIILTANINGAPNGILANQLNADGPVIITAKNQSNNPNNFTISYELGKIGNGNIDVSRPNEDKNETRIAGRFLPGKHLNKTGDIFSKELDFIANINPQSKSGLNGLAIEIDQFNSFYGVTRGTIQWANTQHITDNLTLSATQTFPDNFNPDLQTLIGKNIQLNFNLNKKNQSIFDIIGEIKSENLTAKLDEATTNLSDKLEGSFKLSLLPKNDPNNQNFTRYIGSGTHFNSDITINKDEDISVTNINATLDGDILINQGQADYKITSQSISSDLKASISSKLISTLAPGAQSADPILANIKIDGTLSDLNLSLTSQYPQINLSDISVPAGNLTLIAKDILENVSGNLKANSIEGAGFLKADFTKRNNQFILSNLNYQGAQFLLAGNMSYDTDIQEIITDIRYRGDTNAKPFPGITLGGGATLKGSFGDTENGNTLILNSDILKINNLIIQKLRSQLTGDFTNLNTKTSLGVITQDDLTLAENITTDITISATDSVTIIVQDFAARMIDYYDIKSLKPATLILSDQTKIEDLSLAIGNEGRLSAQLSLSPNEWVANLKTEKIFLPGSDGVFSSNLILNTNEKILAKGEFSFLSNITTRANSYTAHYIWDSKTIQLTNQTPTSGTLSNQILDISIPALLNREPGLTVDTSGPLSGKIKLSSALTPLFSYLPDTPTGLEGNISTDFIISGTIKNPIINGKAALSDAAFTDEKTGLSLVGIHADLEATSANNISIFKFNGGARGSNQEGEDRIRLNGEANLADTMTINSKVDFTDLILSASPVEDITANGQITFNGSPQNIAMKGEIEIDSLNAQIITPPQTGLVGIDIVRTDIDPEKEQLILLQTEEKTVPSQNTLDIDLAINADDKLFIRGRGLNSEWRSNLKVKTVDGAPLTLGDIKLRRGTFDFSGRRFDLTNGEIIFDQLSPNDPIISLTAQYETSEGIVALISASGRASDTKIELTSTPTRSSDDVMAFILFGKPAEDLTAIESLQTAQALASLTGIGPFGGNNVLNSLRQSTGLDLLNVDFDPALGASALTVGKYIADGLFVSASQDVRGQNGSVRIEYELRKNITVESNIQQNGDQTVSANWKKDF